MDINQAIIQYQTLLKEYHRGRNSFSEYINHKTHIYCDEQRFIKEYLLDQKITQKEYDDSIAELKKALDMVPEFFEDPPKDIPTPIDTDLIVANVCELGGLLEADKQLDTYFVISLQNRDEIHKYRVRFKNKKETVLHNNECWSFEGYGCLDGYQEAGCTLIVYKDRNKQDNIYINIYVDWSSPLWAEYSAWLDDRWNRFMQAEEQQLNDLLKTI